MEDSGVSETTVTTAVSTGTDRATVSLAVIPEFSQHTRFSNNNNQTKHKLWLQYIPPTGTEYINAVCHSQKNPAAQLPAPTKQQSTKEWRRIIKYEWRPTNVTSWSDDATTWHGPFRKWHHMAGQWQWRFLTRGFWSDAPFKPCTVYRVGYVYIIDVAQMTF